MRNLIGLFGGACMVLAAAPAEAQNRQYSIAAGSLRSVLTEYVRVSGRQLLFRGDEMAGVGSQGVRGNMSDDQALTQILIGSGFRTKADTSGAIAIVRDQPSPGGDHSAMVDDEDIIVTATRREKRLQDVAQSIAVVTPTVIKAMNANGLADYIDAVPGITLETRGPGQNEISVRGMNSVTSNGTVETTGYYIDDVSQTDDQQSDIELFDIASVEVLRGPQGTLYGEGSLGGTIRLTTNAPDPTKLEAGGDAELSTLKTGGTGHAVRGVLNVPIVNDKLALRAVGYHRRYAGWIDNTANGKSDANDASIGGGRISLRYSSGPLTIDARAIHQNLETGAPQQRNPSLGTANGDQVDLGSDQSTQQRFDQQSLTIRYDLGGAALTAVGAHYKRAQNVNTLLGFGAVNLDVFTDTPVRTWSSEVRLVSSTGGRFDWVVGGYWMDRKDGVNQTANIIGSGEMLLSALGSISRRQLAAFGEGNFRPIPIVELTAGLRYSDERNGYDTTTTYGPLFGLPPETLDKSSSYNALTPRFSVSVKPTEDIMAYALASKGFRAGGNTLLSSVAGIPDNFEPDSVWNYEAGLKTSWLNKVLTVNLGVYRMNWSNLQVPFESPVLAGFVYTANAGSAHTKGLEIEVVARPVEGLTVNLGYGLIDARFDDAVPELGVEAGDRIPGVQRSSWSALINYETPISDAIGLRLNANARHSGRRVSAYSPIPGVDPDRVRAYLLAGVQAGLVFGKWSVTAFSDNLFNKRAVTGYEDFNGLARLDYVVSPRRVGIRLALDY